MHPYKLNVPTINDFLLFFQAGCQHRNREEEEARMKEKIIEQTCIALRNIGIGAKDKDFKPGIPVSTKWL